MNGIICPQGSDSVKSFKNKLKVIYGPKEANKLFAYGHGRSTTNDCRMRLGLSHLRSHLFNYNLINTPFCENDFCDHVAVTPSHYLLKCPKFANERRVMLSEISEIVFPGINHNTTIDLMPDYFCRILIQGSDTLSLETTKTFSGMCSNSLMNLGVSITTMETMHTTSSDVTFKRPHTLTLTHACTHAYVVSLSLSLSTLYALHQTFKYCIYFM